jgi:hypothetical protein
VKMFREIYDFLFKKNFSLLLGPPTYMSHLSCCLVNRLSDSNHERCEFPPSIGKCTDLIVHSQSVFCEEMVQLNKTWCDNDTVIKFCYNITFVVRLVVKITAT